MSPGPRFLLSVALAIGALPAAPKAQIAELTKLLPPAGAMLFGTSISVWGNRALVGASEGLGPDLITSVAYLFERTPDGGWRQVAKLWASDGSGAAQFQGRVGVSLGEHRALLGALFGGLGSKTGAAWVFDEGPAGTWTQSAMLAPNDALHGFGAGFGTSVALDGDRALVGADADKSTFPAGGAAYLFERSRDGSWQQVDKLVPSHVWGMGVFGHSVALDGGVAVVGAPDDDTVACTYVGSAFVFERQANGSWLEVAKLRAQDWDCNDHFGAVALSKDRAVVGCAGDDGLFPNSGAAYVFEPDSTGKWSQTAKLTALDPQPDAGLYTAATSGNRILVGAGSFADPAHSGAAYLFELQGDGTWTQTAKLQSSESSAGDRFGFPVALWHDSASVGGQLNHTNKVDWLFDLEPLSSAVDEISVASGGAQPFELDAGHLHAGQPYLLLGSVSGSSPGVSIGAGFQLPLNPDAYFQWTLLHPNTPPLSSSAGLLSLHGGSGASVLSVPSGVPALAGLTIWHAFLAQDIVTGQVSFVSNAAELTLVP